MKFVKAGTGSRSARALETLRLGRRASSLSVRIASIMTIALRLDGAFRQGEVGVARDLAVRQRAIAADIAFARRARLGRASAVLKSRSCELSRADRRVRRWLDVYV